MIHVSLARLPSGGASLWCSCGCREVLFETGMDEHECLLIERGRDVVDGVFSTADLPGLWRWLALGGAYPRPVRLIQ